MIVLPNESARDFVDRRLYQAHALATSLYGSKGKEFRDTADDIQDGVLWLVADIIEEVQEGMKALAVKS